MSFQVLCPNGNVLELPGTVDKEKSHQNVLLVRTPVVNQLPFGLGHQSILAKVVVITGRSQMFSNSLDFEFIPNGKYMHVLLLDDYLHSILFHLLILSFDRLTLFISALSTG